MADSGAQVLVLGGVGFIGRNLVHYIVSNGLAKKVRVVDKILPVMGYLNKEHQESFSKVEFRHGNLMNSDSVDSAFQTEDGSFDFVINCAAETKHGLEDIVYEEGVTLLSTTCAQVAAKHGVKRYIELSSGQMASTNKKPMKESDDCDPWTKIAKHKLRVEEKLTTIPNLDYICVRPAIVYGKGDRTGLTPRLVIGAVYKFLGEKMKLLWGKDLKMNTVHVDDLCRAIWHLLSHGKTGEVYNIVDKGDTTQGLISELVSQIFGIKYDFVGNTLMNLVKPEDFSEVIEEINDKHMSPWGQACQKEGIVNTPLNPYMDQELLLNKNTYLDGLKIEATGFVFEKPKVNFALLKEVLDDFISMGIFPSSFSR
ncbi:uncharacterized protein LOC106170709 [Lingula anatina]|uniref:Uncharacterized protein LOC106170709 n=1 Tax=Lingula anatina TaxID=7574 RepID=A0A1S3J747_LINAN|nr:uncharacterized protein LOC106170709 [Lingula anatina]|eukprot:XP_013406133.1 uncharacterized protein LOC106170709 [Lingula anatina]